MIRIGGGGSDNSAEEEQRTANLAVIGNGITFALTVLAIHISPYLLEQFGLEVVK